MDKSDINVDGQQNYKLLELSKAEETTIERIILACSIISLVFLFYVLRTIIYTKQYSGGSRSSYLEFIILSQQRKDRDLEVHNLHNQNKHKYSNSSQKLAFSSLFSFFPYSSTKYWKQR